MSFYYIGLLFQLAVFCFSMYLFVLYVVLDYYVDLESKKGYCQLALKPYSLLFSLSCEIKLFITFGPEMGFLNKGIDLYYRATY